jgi:SAM-dependent methyltransferase
VHSRFEKLERVDENGRCGTMSERARGDHVPDVAALIPGHYERHARAWDADRRAAAWIDKCCIESFVALLPAGGTVLDLGCGGGIPVALHLVTNGLRVTGIDSSPTLISLCRERMPNHEWIVADMRRLALAHRFDGVLAWDSFFHLSPDDQRAMFPVFRAHAANGATLMFNAGPSHGEAIGSYRGDPLYHASLDAAEYETLLAENDFELVQHAVNDPQKGGRILWIARVCYG